MKQMHMKHMNVRRRSWSVSERCLPNGSRWKVWKKDDDGRHIPDRTIVVRSRARASGRILVTR